MPPKRRPRSTRSGTSGNATRTALVLLFCLVAVAAVVVVAVVVLKRDRGKPGPGGPGPNGSGAPAVPDEWQWETGPGYEVLVPSRGERKDGLAMLGENVAPSVAAQSKLTTLTVEGIEYMWGHYPAPWSVYGMPPGQSAGLLHRMIDRNNGRDVYVAELSGHPVRDYSYSLAKTRRESHVRAAVVNDTLVLVAVRGAGLEATDPRVKAARESLKLK